MQNGSSLHQDDRKMKMDFNLKPNTHLSSRWKFLFYSNTIKYKLPTDWWLKGDKWQTDVCGNTFRPIPDYWQSIPLPYGQYVPIFDNRRQETLAQKNYFKWIDEIRCLLLWQGKGRFSAIVHFDFDITHNRLYLLYLVHEWDGIVKAQ